MRLSTLILACASLSLATPAQASISIDSLIEVREYSKVVCPLAMKRDESVISSGEWVQQAAREHGYDDEGVLLLLGFCNAYAEGYLAGLRSR